jgi:hypothetical protein
MELPGHEPGSRASHEARRRKRVQDVLGTAVWPPYGLRCLAAAQSVRSLGPRVSGLESLS